MTTEARGFRVIVELWIASGMEAEFERFESQAFEIMKAYGVSDIEVSRPPKVSESDPDEVHVIAFPSREAFDAYRADPALMALSDLRQSSIMRTEVSRV